MLDKEKIIKGVSEMIRKDSRNSIPFPELIAEMSKYYEDVKLTPIERKFTEKDLLHFGEWLSVTNFIFIGDAWLDMESNKKVSPTELLSLFIQQKTKS